MRERLRQEDGIALILALAFTVALSLLVFGMTSYVTSNQHNSQNSNADGVARGYAEAALNVAYSRLIKANTAAGGANPTSPTLLGCTSGANGASNCSAPSVLCIGFTSTCPSPYTVTTGTGTVYGKFTGTTTGSEAGVTGVSSQWILVATGYARNASGKTDAKTLRATVLISAGGSGAVASVWNHVFMTAPYVAGVCQANFAGNNLVIDVPLYVVGNLCLSGQGVVMKEKAGGQALDLQVGGALSLSGSGSSVGDFTTTPTTGITSAVVVGGCTNGAITTTTASCTNGSYRYSAKNVGSYVSQQSPEETDTDMAADYAAFDPGPKHTCLTGVTTPGPPLADNVFDYSQAASGEPNLSGSGTSGGSFELVPGSSYSCISKSTNGASTGELTWNNGSSTSGGVAAKTLKVNGSIFIDGNLTISQSLTYTGTAVIEVSGTITINGNGTTICAVNTSCVFTNWQGSSGHNDMLTFVTLKKSAPSITFTNNSQTFQGSLWTQPSGGMTFVKNGVDIQGPMALGSFDATFNNATIEPLPVIKNMPVGAPVPPNVSAQVGPLNVIG
jgi:Tfp pilus assembly protein PilX